MLARIARAKAKRRIWAAGHIPAALAAILLLAAALLPVGLASAQNSPGITSPTDGEAVSGDVVLQGTAVIDTFQKYELHFKQEPSGDDAFIYFDGGTQPVVNGQLGVWRASGLPAGTYSLRLRVVKADGNYAEYFARNVVLNLQPAQPTPTPTSDQPTPTPIPVITATFTPVVQPTAAVVNVEQPSAVEPTPTPEPVAVQVDTGSGDGAAQPVADAAAAEASGSTNLIARELGEAVAVDRLRGEFFRGMRLAASVVIVLLAIFGGKALFGWYRTREEF